MTLLRRQQTQKRGRDERRVMEKTQAKSPGGQEPGSEMPG